MIIRTDIRRLPGLLKRDAKRIEKAIKRAVENTAVKAVKPIRKRVPKAFGELQESIVGDRRGKNDVPVTSADAPHAGSVEIGSKPHTPDFRRLVEWVRLRGFQGLTGGGRIRKRFRAEDGPTTPRQARRVASMFKSLEVRGKKGVGRHSPVDSAEQVAKAISKGIEKHGTKPHWFVRNSLPEIRDILGTELKSAIHAPGSRSK